MKAVNKKANYQPGKSYKCTDQCIFVFYSRELVSSFGVYGCQKDNLHQSGNFLINIWGSVRSGSGLSPDVYAVHALFEMYMKSLDSRSPSCADTNTADNLVVHNYTLNQYFCSENILFP